MKWGCRDLMRRPEKFGASADGHISFGGVYLGHSLRLLRVHGAPVGNVWECSTCGDVFGGGDVETEGES